MDRGKTPGTVETVQHSLPGIKDVNEFTQTTLKAVLQATKSSNDLPAAGDDFDYYSSFQGFRDILDIEGKRILHIIQNVLKHQNVKGKLSGSSDVLDLEDKFDVLTDANDQILERVGAWLDEASGIKKTDNTLVVASVTPKQVSTSWNKKTPTAQSKVSTSFHLLSARNIQRPQLRFKDKIDNRNRPFVPSIKHKPNALKSLYDSMHLPEDVTAEMMEGVDFSYPHPYQYELDHVTPVQEMLEPSEPVMPKSLEETAYSFINTVSDLVEMCDQLKSEKLIAVDLEHHSYRTFQGILCLMQVSTRNHDYLVDTLELRSDLYMLNEVFTDPNILKVLHGADMDIQWLQRDLVVYIVNMFDTGQASRVLNLSRFSLAHLLQMYCGIEADKQYQLADWRIRPLPDELVKYAREDTHYLLFIYEKLRNELITRGNEQKNLLYSVFQRSTQISAIVYKKNVFKEEDYLDLYHKSKKIFNSHQLTTLQNLYSWRDKTARIEDESLGYILPNHMLLQIAEILPRERQGVFACCNPIPPLVRQYLNEIHDIIMKARETPLVKVQTRKINRPTYKQHPKYDSESLLLCPHDLSHSRSHTNTDQQTVLLSDPSVLTSTTQTYEQNTGSGIVLKTEPLLTAFLYTNAEDMQTKARKLAAEIKATFASPIDKYLPKETKKSMLSSGKLKGGVNRTGTDTWVLVKNTVKRKHTDKEEASGPPTKRKKTEETSRNDDEEEEPIIFRSVRQIKAEQKKPEYSEVKKVDRLSVNPLVPDEGLKDSKKKKKKKRQIEEELAATQITPYDYSQTDSSLFQGGPSGKTDVFNPNRHKKGKDRRGDKAPKPTLSTGKSNKSYSYTGKEHSGKKNWPKK